MPPQLCVFGFLEVFWFSEVFWCLQVFRVFWKCFRLSACVLEFLSVLVFEKYFVPLSHRTLGVIIKLITVFEKFSNIFGPFE